jgi:hypothetical protein
MGLRSEMENQRLAMSFESAEGFVNRMFITKIAAMNGDIVTLVADVIQFAAGRCSDENMNIGVKPNEPINEVRPNETISAGDKDRSI